MPCRPSYGTGWARYACDSEVPRPSFSGAWIPSLGNTGIALRDVSGRHNHGTFVGGPTWQIANGRRCLLYDGVDDYCNLGTKVLSEAGRAGITLAAWVRPLNISISAYIRPVVVCGLWGGDGVGDFALGLRTAGGAAPSGNGRWGFDLDTVITGRRSLQDTVDATAGGWVHVCGTWDGHDMYLFKNGNQVATAPQIGLNTNNDKSRYLGAYPGNVANTAINAHIADVVISPFAWPVSLIKQHFTDPYAMWREREDVNDGVSRVVLPPHLLNQSFAEV